MKKKENSLFFLFPLALTLTSCSFLPALKTGYITIDCSSGGKIVTVAKENTYYSTGVEVVLFPEAESGYKLTNLKVNGNSILETESFILGSGENKIEADFTLIDEINKEYDYEVKDDHLLLEDVYNAAGLPVLPSLGVTKALVVPINFSEYDSFNKSELDALNASFNGTNPDGTNSYWESVSSYYYKSSYEKLNLKFTICDAIDSPLSAKEFIKKEGTSDARGVSEILDYIYNRLTIDSNKIDYTNYDTNKDGYVDGLWLVYNVDDIDQVYNKHNFWAYTYWNVNESTKPNVKKPKFGVFANCAEAFLYEGSKDGHDAHTLIHETGHMFGLDDYYSYDNVKASSIGGLDMMDLNIGDHNSFSKYALGWINPRVINKKNEDIILNSFTDTGECLLISNSYSDSPFDEYFLVEFYTNTNLNKLDSENNYGINNYANPYNRLYEYDGIKIIHVDSRLAKYSDLDNFYMNNGTIKDLPEFPIYYPVYTVGTSNTASKSYKHDSKGRYNLLEIITPSNTRTYNYNNLGTDVYGNEALRGLFLEGEVMSSINQSNFFLNENKLHNGASFNYSIEIKDITEENATIVIR